MCLAADEGIGVAERQEDGVVQLCCVQADEPRLWELHERGASVEVLRRKHGSDNLSQSYRQHLHRGVGTGNSSCGIGIRQRGVGDYDDYLGQLDGHAVARAGAE
jgi:hypothetical protein